LPFTRGVELLFGRDWLGRANPENIT